MIEPEIALGRRAFAASQDRWSGSVMTDVAEVETCGWHGTSVDPEEGAFAVLSRSLVDLSLTGRIVEVRSGARSCFVYVLGVRDVPTDISLSRRAFMALAPLWKESLRVQVGVVS